MIAAFWSVSFAVVPSALGADVVWASAGTLTLERIKASTVVVIRIRVSPNGASGASNSDQRGQAVNLCRLYAHERCDLSLRCRQQSDQPGIRALFAFGGQSSGRFLPGRQQHRRGRVGARQHHMGLNPRLAALAEPAADCAPNAPMAARFECSMRGRARASSALVRSFLARRVTPVVNGLL